MAYTDNYPSNIEAPNRIFMQYSHDIDFDYSTGRFPNGSESSFDWEDNFIPVEHYLNGVLVGSHVWMKTKIGTDGIYSTPMRINIPISIIDKLELQNLGYNAATKTTTYNFKFTLQDTEVITTNNFEVINGSLSNDEFVTILQEYFSGAFADNQILESRVSGGITSLVSVPKNTAYNKNFGTASTEVARGNHLHSQYDPINHTGDVTGTTTLTIDKTAITGKTPASATVSDIVLISDTDAGGALKQATVQSIVDLAKVVDADKGDITVTNSGTTWTIDPGVVNLAKMSDVATGTVFYRKDLLTGPPQVQTLATLKADLGLSGTNTGDQTITLSTDVTTSSMSNGTYVATIPNDTISNAKLANMAANTIKANNTTNSTDPTDVALSTQQVLGRLDGNIEAIDLVENQLMTNDISGTILEIDSNWVDAQSSAMSGLAGDRYSGTTKIGIKLIAEYTASNFWLRSLSQPYIDVTTTNGILLKAQLETESNWVTSEYNANYGDIGYKYHNSSYEYECISNNGTTHTWIRKEKFIGTVIIPDTTYLPVPSISNYLTTETFTIPIQHKIISIVLRNANTTGGFIQIGSTAGDDDLVASTAIPANTTSLVELDYQKLNSMLSITATKDIHITLTTSTEVTLYIITQKF
jgi:hypothetical protein